MVDIVHTSEIPAHQNKCQSLFSTQEYFYILRYFLVLVNYLYILQKIRLYLYVTFIYLPIFITNIIVQSKSIKSNTAERINPTNFNSLFNLFVTHIKQCWRSMLRNSILRIDSLTIYFEILKYQKIMKFYMNISTFKFNELLNKKQINRSVNFLLS